MSDLEFIDKIMKQRYEKDPYQYPCHFDYLTTISEVSVNTDNATYLIDKIHDYCENKTCSSCKWNLKTHEIFENSCNLLAYGDASVPTPDGFGCNRWERKDDK